MSHIYIFGLIFNLVIGIFIYSYARQIYQKKRYSFPKPFLAYIIYFNILVAAYFITQYLFTNVFTGSGDFNPVNKVLFMVRLIIFITGEFGITISLYRTSCFLRDKPSSRPIIIGIFGFLFVFLGLYTAANISFFNSGTAKYLASLDMLWEGLINLFIIMIAFHAYFASRRVKKNQISLRNFGLIFLAGYFIYAIPQISFYEFGVGIGKYIDPVILIIVNFISFIWIRLSFHPGTFIPHDQPIQEALKNLYLKNGISNREAEIIQHILDGKTNQQICDDLFLSFHTVKNHLYTIYKKLDVNSRSQLITLINKLGPKT